MMPKKFVKYLFILFVILGLFVPWFRYIIFENIILAVLFLITSFLLIVTYYSKDRRLNIILILFFAILTFNYLKSVNVKEEYTFTPSELDQQIQRMNMYPPKLARLGYIL